MSYIVLGDYDQDEQMTRFNKVGHQYLIVDRRKNDSVEIIILRSATKRLIKWYGSQVLL